MGRAYAFANLSLDLDRRELRTGNALVPVEPLVFDTLHYLIRNRDRVVSKDDLIAEVWKTRIVSDSTLSSTIAAVRQAVGDSGEAQRVVRTMPRKGFRFVADVIETTEKAHAVDEKTVDPAAPPLPDKPSIAVLPFLNMSGDPEQEYFADGITEDLTTALSHFRMLFVIARGSSFTYKRRSVDIKQVGRDLGVRYVLEGSVRKAGNRVRITGQLNDASLGVQLWADRFDGALEDIFDLQDQVTASVAGAIAPKLEQAEIERSRRKPTDNLDAYDYFLRGMAAAVLYTREGYIESTRLFRRAIDLDPGFAVAYGMASYNFVTQKTNGWLVDRASEIAEGFRMASRAVEFGSDDAAALSAGGMGLAYLGRDLNGGLASTNRALELNPNLGTAWYVSGWLRTFAGDHKTAFEHVERAIRFSPLDPLIFRAHSAKGYAYFFSGEYDRAVEWSEKAVRARPTWLTAVRGAAASYTLSGRLDEGRRWMDRMRELDPALRLSNLHEMLPLRRPEDVEKWTDALRRAGLPAE